MRRAGRGPCAGVGRAVGAASTRRIVDAHARGVGERERRIASANVRYHLMASAWHYYRDYFGFPLEEAIACAEVAVRQSLEGVGIATPARGARGGRRAPIR